MKANTIEKKDTTPKPDAEDIRFEAIRQTKAWKDKCRDTFCRNYEKEDNDF
jgi:hypothetical protein